MVRAFALVCACVTAWLVVHVLLTTSIMVGRVYARMDWCLQPMGQSTAHMACLLSDGGLWCVLVLVRGGVRRAACSAAVQPRSPCCSAASSRAPAAACRGDPAAADGH